MPQQRRDRADWLTAVGGAVDGGLTAATTAVDSVAVAVAGAVPVPAATAAAEMLNC